MSDPRQIGGRYQILERLGKGAMGVVYKAHDPVLDRVVAVKKMAAEIGEDEDLRRRFYVEARAAARLNHRNIVTVHEFQEVAGEIFIVMELLEGVDLATVIRRQVGLPLEAKLSVVSQLCEGLEYAHQHGVIHRDIKPGNLHLSGSGLVKILDFGIARLGSSKMTGTGALIGTPDYMSPEQVLGESIDARSDLFAVGAVFYELMSACRPFEGDGVAALLMKIARSPHVPLGQRVPDAPPQIVDLIDRLMAKDPGARPASADAVVQELGQIAAAIKRGSPSAAAEIIGSMVTEQTMLARTPLPLTPRPAGADRPGATGTPLPALAGTPVSRERSNARLASLALQRGRALRESGDLAGAMEVFRSVLEVAPGNAEAMEELQRLEADLRRGTARSAAVTAFKRRRWLGALGMGLVVLAMGTGAGWYAWSKSTPSSSERAVVHKTVAPAVGAFAESLPEPRSAESAERQPLEQPRQTKPAPTEAARPRGVPSEPTTEVATPPVPAVDQSRLAAFARRRLDRRPPQFAPGVPPLVVEEKQQSTAQPPVTREEETAPPVPATPPPDRRPAEMAPGTIDTLTGRRIARGLESFSAGASVQAATARIRMVIERYARAMQERDGPTVRSLRRGLLPFEMKLLEQGREVSFRLEVVNVESDGLEGSATCHGTVEAVLASGEKMTQNGPMTMRLVRLPRGWIITEVVNK